MKKILLSTTILASMLVSAAYADAAAPVTPVVPAVTSAKKTTKNTTTTTNTVVVPAAPVLMPDDSNVKTATASFGGMFDFQFGYRSQSDAYDAMSSSWLSANQQHYALASQSMVAAKFEDSTDQGLKYGANIVLQTVSDRTKGFLGGKNKSFLYLESEKGGRIELGSHDGPSRVMTVGAFTIAAGDGGVDGDSWDYVADVATTATAVDAIALDNDTIADAIWTPHTLINRNVNFEGARRVSYYTPMINGFQAGVGFAPDLSNNATDYVVNGVGAVPTNSPTNTAPSQANKMGFNANVKNHWSVGLKYEQVVNDKSTIGVSAVMDKAIVTGGAGVSNPLVNNITSYEFGAMFGMNNFKVAASYGTDGKSASAIAAPAPAASGATYGSTYYTAGVAYEQGPTAVSLTYSNAKVGYTDFKVKTSLISVGADYNLAAGLTPYVSVNFYKNSGDAVTITENKGTVVLVGTKVTF